MKVDQRIGVLIPTYNAGSKLKEVAEKTTSIVGKENIVVVDDGSTDGSTESLNGLGIKVLKHEKNQGKGRALVTGFSYFLSQGYDGVVTIDSDGQHDPGLIPALVDEAAKSGAGIVIGSRIKRTENMPFHRQIGNAIGSALISLAAGTKVPDSQSGFRFISREVLSSITLETNRYETESELLIKATRKGFKLGTVPMPAAYANEKSFMNPILDPFRIFLLTVRSFFWKR